MKDAGVQRSLLKPKMLICSCSRETLLMLNGVPVCVECFKKKLLEEEKQSGHEAKK